MIVRQERAIVRYCRFHTDTHKLGHLTPHRVARRKIACILVIDETSIGGFQVRNFIGSMFAYMGGTAFIALWGGGLIGWMFWMWMSIQLGSFLMFAFGLLGPLGLVAGLLGLWSLLFGAPEWLLSLVN